MGEMGEKGKIGRKMGAGPPLEISGNLRVQKPGISPDMKFFRPVPLFWGGIIYDGVCSDGKISHGTRSEV